MGTGWRGGDKRKGRDWRSRVEDRGWVGGGGEGEEGTRHRIDD